MPSASVGRPADPDFRRAPAWAYVVFALLVAGVAAGGYWLKSSPPSAFGGPPETVQRLLARGIAAHAAGSYDSALALYGQVIQREPGNARAHFNTAQIHLVREQYEMAESSYRAALDADPDFAGARMNLGVALYKQRKFAPAAEQFRRVVQASPDDPLGLFNLGISVLELGQDGEAVRLLTAASRAD
ncbi:MAG TPA: tetratricopeptide repeat protein, partial [Candidatus Methylomirabilis sp.]|nr:tetratricopeptide repeat protein [Candidatus Methylomirabilis sp.]